MRQRYEQMMRYDAEAAKLALCLLEQELEYEDRKTIPDQVYEMVLICAMAKVNHKIASSEKV